MVDIESQDGITLSAERIREEGLAQWAAAFKLGTAGYRDQLDPEDMDNPKAAFNRVKVAVMAEAKAQVYDGLRKQDDGVIERHVGGEVRPHTPAFIDVAARVYAAYSGFHCEAYCR